MIKVVTVTGYKPYELGIFDAKHSGICYIKAILHKKLIQLIEEGAEWFMISGQPGVELWAAEELIELKQTYPEVGLAVITPFLNQEQRWGDATKQRYQHILAQADYVNSITKKEYERPAQLRLKNDFFIAKSDALLILYDEEKPGTPDYYLKSAKRKKDYEIIYMMPDDVEAAAEEVQEEDPNYWTQ
jgi:uncharacterized phage-like protein YoqJ